MKKTFLLLTLVLALALCGCFAPQSQTKFLLNTAVKVTLYGEQSACYDELFEICREYQALFDRNSPDSDIYKINNSSGEVEVDNATADVIAAALPYYIESEGKFDITVGAVSRLWDFNNQVMPDSKEITSALSNIGYNKLKIDQNKITSNGCIIDLGGIAKGYIADRMVEYINQKGIKKAVLDLGGNVTIVGDVQKVGIRRPFSEDVITAVSVGNATVSTSGVYERCFEKQGKSYHHILDSKTGYPADSDLLSATVICKSGTAADALSTVCILLGKEKATALIEKLPESQAIFVDKNYSVTATSGLELKGKTYYLT